MFVIGHTVASFFSFYFFLLLQHRSLRWEINQMSGGFFSVAIKLFLQLSKREKSQS